MRIFSFLLFFLIANSTIAQKVIPLYDDKPKGSENWTWSEGVYTDEILNDSFVYNVVEPTLTAYLPPYYLATGTAVIIAPGGAFHLLSYNNEGTKVAKWLNSQGIAAFVLKYRLVHSRTDNPVQELMWKMANVEQLDGH